MILLTTKAKRYVNENDLAVEIARKEGGKVNQNIGQIKEVSALTLDWLGAEFQTNPRGVFELLRRHKT